jgi:3-oxoacyl-[acyl-carrier-protein] synthase II
MADWIEAKAVERLMGDHAPHVALSSTKSMIGHLLGAAGAVEAVFCVLALRDQIAPPTINLDDPEQETALIMVKDKGRPMKIDTAMSNSFGFGGTNACVIFQKAD